MPHTSHQQKIEELIKKYPQENALQNAAQMIILEEAITYGEQQTLRKVMEMIEEKYGKQGKMSGSLGYQGIVMDIHAYQTPEDQQRDWILSSLSTLMNE